MYYELDTLLRPRIKLLPLNCPHFYLIFPPFYRPTWAGRLLELPDPPEHLDDGAGADGLADDAALLLLLLHLVLLEGLGVALVGQGSIDWPDVGGEELSDQRNCPIIYMVTGGR